jgi:hypothetical protein
VLEQSQGGLGAQWSEVHWLRFWVGGVVHGAQRVSFRFEFTSANRLDGEFFSRRARRGRAAAVQSAASE